MPRYDTFREGFRFGGKIVNKDKQCEHDHPLITNAAKCFQISLVRVLMTSEFPVKPMELIISHWF